MVEPIFTESAAAALAGFSHRAQTQSIADTDAFKAWFKGSKVIDADGRPLVVYHSTNAVFTEFKRVASAHLGYHFGTDDQARRRGGKYTMQTHLRMENPLRTIDAGDWSNPYRAWEVVNKKVRGALDDMLQRLIEQDPRQARLTAIVERIKSLGYDGIVYKNRIEGVGDSWIVFDAVQVKSATSNNSEFSPANADIRFSVADADSEDKQNENSNLEVPHG